MIQVLGTRRMIILAGLVALNALLAAVVYGYFMPDKIKVTRNLAAVSGQVSTLHADVSNISIELDEIQEKQGEYEGIVGDGFFSDQDRRQAEGILRDVQEQSGVIFVKASVGGKKVIENDLAQKAGHVIIESIVSVSIDSLDDIDLFHYIHLMQTSLPGHVTIDTMTIKRQRDLTGALLRRIASGNDPEMVNASVDFKWRTMVPETSVDKDGRG